MNGPVMGDYGQIRREFSCTTVLYLSSVSYLYFWSHCYYGVDYQTIKEKKENISMYRRMREFAPTNEFSFVLDQTTTRNVE